MTRTASTVPADTTGRPLVPSRLRWPACWLVLGCVAVLLVLGGLYHGQHHGGQLDNAVDGWVTRQLSQYDDILWSILRLVDVRIVVALLAITAIAGWRLHRKRLVIFAAIGPATAMAITEFIAKPLVGRTKSGVLAFPSGHTTVTVSTFVALGFLISTVSYLWLRTIFAVVGALIVLSVGLALVDFGYHYASDVVGGVCVALGSTVGIALLIDVLAEQPAFSQGSSSTAL